MADDTPKWKKNNPNYNPINGAQPLTSKPGMEDFDPNEYLEYSPENPTGKPFGKGQFHNIQSNPLNGPGGPKKVNRGKTKKKK